MAVPHPQAAFVYRNHYPSKEQMERLRMPKNKIRLLPLGSVTLDSISLDNFYQVGERPVAPHAGHEDAP